MPLRINRSVSMSRWPRTSWSNSSSRRRRKVAQIRENTARSIGLMLPLQLQHPADDVRDATPILGFTHELFASGFGDRIEPRLPVVFRDAPPRTNPPLL